MTRITHISLRALICITIFALLLSFVGCSMVTVTEKPPQQEPDVPEVSEPEEDGKEGYLSAAICGSDFIACGTGGRIDAISTDGQITSLDSGTTETLTNVFTEGSHVLVSGTNGTLLQSDDAGSSFRKLDVGTTGSLNAAVVYQGTMLAAGEGGIIYRQNPGGWEPVQMERENEIISLIATDYCVAAITAETDVYISTDSLNWTSMNFNEVYDGLYPRYVFTRAVGAGGTFFVLGYPEENPNEPLIMFTELGEVWMHKEMMEINGEPMNPEKDMFVHDICFNVEQIVGVLNGGRVLAITSCTTCNEEKQLDVENALWATASQPDHVLVCGEDFFSRVLSGKQIRQDKIGAEQAQADIERGAILIDVREADEIAADGYIPGSIHVPLAEVEARLPELVPDYYTEIIFYCASGMRSQKATEQAVEMGYYTVYNLGGLGDWPYEIVKD